MPVDARGSAYELGRYLFSAMLRTTKQWRPKTQDIKFTVEEAEEDCRPGGPAEEKAAVELCCK